jgi:hypothetical protein
MNKLHVWDLMHDRKTRDFTVEKLGETEMRN